MFATRGGLKVVAPIAAGLLLAACSGSSQLTSTATAPAASTTSSRSDADSPATFVAPSMVAPFTVAAAQKAATKFLDLYAAGQYAAAWELIAPGLRKNMSEAAWVGVHDACTSLTAGLTYEVGHATPAGGLVVFMVSPEVARNEQVAFTYSDGAWWYDPSDGWIYFGRTFQQALATAKAKGRCSS